MKSLTDTVEETLKKTVYNPETEYVIGIKYANFNNYSRIELVYELMKYRHIIEKYVKEEF